MRVYMNKANVMISEEWQKVMQKAVRWPCGVCSGGVGNNSVQCNSSQKWVQEMCMKRYVLAKNCLKEMQSYKG